MRQKYASSWASRYPVLLACLRDGRAATSRELRAVAARLGRELGLDADFRIDGDGAIGPIQRRIVALARFALEGEDRQTSRRATGLVPRGH
jgi:hypothetical protein